MPDLFETTTINSLTLANRFVRSATWMGFANEDGTCSEKLLSIMRQLAEGHIGLIISGFAFISRDGQVVPFQLGAFSHEMLPGLNEMSQTVHDANGKIVLQLVHGGLFANPQLTGCESFGPSPMMTENGTIGHEMTKQEIQKTIQSFKEAAIFAQKAGFDGIQIHAAHGFLLSQFLSPFFNKRKDEYGGSIQNRTKLLLEIVQSIRKALGDHFPILVKMNADDLLEGGFSTDDAIQAAKMLESLGVDAVELSGGTALGVIMEKPEISFSRLGSNGVYYEDTAKRYKQEIGIPLMLVGGIRSFEVSQRLVENGITDYISLCRPFIREPNLIKRWESGDRRKAECVSDNLCSQHANEGKGVYCAHLVDHELV